MNPKVSIITISYNAENMIDETIRSVLDQTFTDYEYVFIDGKSKDGTVETIRSYLDRFEEKGVSYQLISEPDKGIYDAMNKGVALAKGQWVLMLNAGDAFAHDRVLEVFFKDQEYKSDIVYGDVVYKFDTGKKIYYKRSAPAPLEKIKEGMVFCHQCVFVRNEILKKYGFDTQYKIVADYDSFIRAYLDDVSFEYVNKAVAIYDCAGLSTSNIKGALTETALIKEKAGFSFENKSINKLKFRYKNLIRVLIQRLFPQIAFAEWRGWYEQVPKNLL